MIRFFNTLSGRLEDFAPLDPPRVKLYTCGPTVYDRPHIGNYRAYVFEDLLKRHLLYTGHSVTHVMNITDVDDKTIRGAADRGVSLDDYTAPFIEAFFAGLKTLNILPADVYPRATEHIADMAAMIQGLLDKGFAYRREGSVYFSIARFAGYGKLSKIKREDLQPGQRGEADEYEKENAQDFALWKAPKPGEPFWETEIGPGRPGWHIECSAMSSRYLGDAFDIHCGGIDNIFPHHENEIAQSEAFFGRPWVRYWLHAHHLIVDGEKMSKSKGNVYTLDDLAARGTDPLTLRFLLLATHYRKTLNFTWGALAQAGASRQRLLDFLHELRHVRATRPQASALPGLLSAARTGFTAALDDDLNISGALAAVFDVVREVNTLLARGELGAADAATVTAALADFDRVLGILPAFADTDLDAEVRLKIEAREEARKRRDFALADAIRAELLASGIILEDTKEGVRWKRAPNGRAGS